MIPFKRSYDYTNKNNLLEFKFKKNYALFNDDNIAAIC